MTFTAYKLFFKALSNEGRFNIIQALQKGPLCVNEICFYTRLKQSRTSRSLRCLEHCGFITRERKGKRVYYTLDKKTVQPMVLMIERHVASFDQHLKTCNIIGK